MTDHDSMVKKINAALDHIDKHGGLAGFPSTEEESKALIDAATAQGLIAWNATLNRYELSRIARKWLDAFHGRGRPPAR
jgi:hypothetical protein